MSAPGNPAGPVSGDVSVAGAFDARDLDELIGATEAAISDGGGFGWLTPPPRPVMESWWQGVLLVPERTLFVARLEDVICGSVQLVRPGRNAEATAFVAQVTTFFLAPWARGHGLGRRMLEALEALASEEGFTMLQLDVRETQEHAIQLYEMSGYRRWGTNPDYARVGDRIIAGHYYSKALDR